LGKEVSPGRADAGATNGATTESVVLRIGLIPPGSRGTGDPRAAAESLGNGLV